MERLVERLGSLTQRLELSQADVARVLGTSRRTVARWLREQNAPRGDVRERLLESLYVLERLSGVLKPEPAHDWLLSPNALLGDAKPADLLREGRYKDVLAAIDALGEGVFV